MSSFTKNLEWDKIPKKHFWHRQLYIITAPFEYITEAGEKIGIETGFVLDFASTPWCIRWLYPAIGWYAKAVALHDKGYRDHNGKSKGWWDDIMVEAMKVIARNLIGKITKKYKRDIAIFYWAVKNFGGKAWKKSS